MRTTSFNESKWGIYPRERHTSLYLAETEASWLQEKLNGDNPILVIHPQANSWTSFTNIISNPYVRIDYNASTSDFKPLDIAWIKKKLAGNEYYHVGVYLGNGKIIQLLLGGGFAGTEMGSEGVKKTSWLEFLEGRIGNIRRYSPVIPFKNYKTIIQQLIRANDDSYGEKNYNLLNRNCEHFANKVVLNINFSQQIHENETKLLALNVTKASLSGVSYGAGLAGVALAPLTGGASLLIGVPASVAGLFGISRVEGGEYTTMNNDKTSICLRNEINSDFLNAKQDWETEKHEQEYQAQIQAPVKTGDCVIM